MCRRHHPPNPNLLSSPCSHIGSDGALAASRRHHPFTSMVVDGLAMELFAFSDQLFKIWILLILVQLCSRWCDSSSPSCLWACSVRIFMKPER
ncbi:hypothetical protein A2U01_0053427, partial [Trifolium medium]|nr:hypothetical protein [Trifolium medium]